MKTSERQIQQIATNTEQAEQDLVEEIRRTLGSDDPLWRAA